MTEAPNTVSPDGGADADPRLPGEPAGPGYVAPVDPVEPQVREVPERNAPWRK